MDKIRAKLQQIKENNLYRQIKYLNKPQDKYTTINNKRSF